MSEYIRFDDYDSQQKGIHQRLVGGPIVYGEPEDDHVTAYTTSAAGSRRRPRQSRGNGAVLMIMCCLIGAGLIGFTVYLATQIAELRADIQANYTTYLQHSSELDAVESALANLEADLTDKNADQDEALAALHLALAEFKEVQGNRDNGQDADISSLHGAHNLLKTRVDGHDVLMEALQVAIDGVAAGVLANQIRLDKLEELSSNTLQCTEQVTLANVCNVLDPILVSGYSARRATNYTSCMRSTIGSVEVIEYDGESTVAVNPVNTKNLIITGAQNFYPSLGISGGFGAAVWYSVDSGITWQQSSIILDRCQGSSSRLSEADFEIASNPHVSFDDYGNAYLYVTLRNYLENNIESTVFSKSTDGGSTWSVLRHTTRDNGAVNFHEYPMLSVDWHRPRNFYAAWTDYAVDGTVGAESQRAVFQCSEDGGITWYTGSINQLGSRNLEQNPFVGRGYAIHVLPDTSILSVGAVYNYTNITGAPWIIRSAKTNNRGADWYGFDGPVFLHARTVDPVKDRTIEYRTHASAINRCTGRAYAVFTAGDIYTGGAFERGYGTGIGMQYSPDGGQTWNGNGSFIIANSHTETQAFMPNVVVAADGAVGVLYADFRNTVAGSGVLLADWWLAIFNDNLTELLSEHRLTKQSFNMHHSIDRSFSSFIGNYAGIAADGNDFVASIPTSSYEVEGFVFDRGDIFFVRVKRSAVCDSPGNGTLATRIVAAAA